VTDDSPRRLGIPEEVARSEGVPDDLDSTQREPYTIPSTRRRRIAAVVYETGAIGVAVAVFLGAPPGLLILSALLIAVGGWHFAAAWPIRVLDPAALETANREVPFAVGHASAVVGFDGWRAKPVWNVLVFDAAEPPSQRALVRVDAVDGHVVEKYVEEIAT
jgi:hypothetical protein